MNKPLRIGLIMQGGRSWLGGTEYIKNIALALSKLPEDIRLTFQVYILHSQSIEYDVKVSLDACVTSFISLEEKLPSLSIPNRLNWKIQRTLLKRLNPRLDNFLKSNLDFIYPYYSPNLVNSSSCQTCPWIYDFQHKYLPELFSVQEIASRNQEFELIAKRSQRVVLSSKTAESDFHRFFPNSSCKTEVLPFRTIRPLEWCQGNPEAIQQKYCLPDRFFLISNQFWQHKNHLLVFKALKLLKEQGVHPILACTGHIYDHRKPEFSDEILRTIHQLGIAQQIYLLGLIPKLDQVQLLRRSIAVIQPSLFEGWSTVVEDARCLGKVILLSDFPVHLEQNPPHSVLFNRYSPNNLASAMAEQWHALKPGPHTKQEHEASLNNHKQVRAFGEQFLKIACEN